MDNIKIYFGDNINTVIEVPDADGFVRDTLYNIKNPWFKIKDKNIGNKSFIYNLNQIKIIEITYKGE